MKEKVTMKQENYKMKKLTIKNKHIVKVGNYSHTASRKIERQKSKMTYVHNKQLRNI